MTTGSTPGKPGFSGKADADRSNCRVRSGMEKKPRKRYIYQKGLRKNWKPKDG